MPPDEYRDDVSPALIRLHRFLKIYVRWARIVTTVCLMALAVAFLANL